MLFGDRMKLLLLKLIKFKYFWIGFVILSFFSWLQIRHISQIRYLNNQLVNTQTEYLNQRKSDSLTIIKKADKNKELNGIIISQAKVIAKWKDSYFNILDAVQDTTETGSIRVTFTDSTKCTKVFGFTETATKDKLEFAKVDIENKPVGFTVEYATVGRDIYGIIQPMNDCIEFIDPQFNISDNLNFKQPSSDKHWYYFGAGAITMAVLVFLIK